MFEGHRTNQELPDLARNVAIAFVASAQLARTGRRRQSRQARDTYMSQCECKEAETAKDVARLSKVPHGEPSRR